MVIALDMDGVIAVGMEGPDWDVSVCVPVEGAIGGVARLRAAGHSVFLHTSRLPFDMVGTLDWLRAQGIEVDGIAFKPLADLYVDDRGYRFQDWSALLEDLGL